MASERSIFDRLYKEFPRESTQVLLMRKAFGQWSDSQDAGERPIFSDHLENVLDQEQDILHSPPFRGRPRRRGAPATHAAAVRRVRRK